MPEQLITVGEATEILGVTSDLPANKCLTKAEFDELTGRLQPESAPNGVYIMHKDRFLVKKERWAFPNEDASGVAVKTDKCSVVIAKEEQTSIGWGGYGTLINGCTTTTNKNTAEIDYKGSQNTDAIIAKLGESKTYAARYCKEYTFPHGAQGYLPALGELYEAYQNKSEVDACMSLIGGKPLYDDSINNYEKWSSTQYETYDAWDLRWDDGNIDYSNKFNSLNFYCARPFAAFQ